MNGVFPVTGWALDDGEVNLVEVLVDGMAVGQALTGCTGRTSAIASEPPDAAYAGFVRMLNTRPHQRVHSVSIRITDDDGTSRVIGRRFVQTFNTGYNLPPSAPSTSRSRTTSCSPRAARIRRLLDAPFEDPQVVELIAGWALDVGSRTDLAASPTCSCCSMGRFSPTPTWAATTAVAASRRQLLRPSRMDICACSPTSQRQGLGFAFRMTSPT